MPRLKTIVMVPQGAEFKAVLKGIKSHGKSTQATKTLEVVSLPVGPEPVQRFLTQWIAKPDIQTPLHDIRVVVMGLCGSLSPDLNIGDVVLYKQCLNGVVAPSSPSLACSIDVPLASVKDFISTVTPVTGVMCDRVVSTIPEKRQLAQQYQAQVVDMEGFSVLTVLQPQVHNVAMLRVVSDDAGHNLPNLTAAFDSNGNIRPFVLMSQFLRQPLGATRLIQGSLTGLKKLEVMSYALALGLTQETT